MVQNLRAQIIGLLILLSSSDIQSCILNSNAMFGFGPLKKMVILLLLVVILLLLYVILLKKCSGHSPVIVCSDDGFVFVRFMF